MIFMVYLLTIISICRGDVSHLDTDLRDDGYHYKLPQKPFPPGKNDVKEFISGPPQMKPEMRTPPSITKPPRPTAEYLPPDGKKLTYQPTTQKLPTQPTLQENNYPSSITPVSDLPSEPTKQSVPSSYQGSSEQNGALLPTIPKQIQKTFANTPEQYKPTGATVVRERIPPTERPSKKQNLPTTFIPQSSLPDIPKQTTERTPEEYGPPITSISRIPKPQQKTTTFVPTTIPHQPRVPSSPEREYLPPDDNSISFDQSPKIPSSVPTLPSRETVPHHPVTRQPAVSSKPKASGFKTTVPESHPTFGTPKSTLPASEQTYPESQFPFTEESGPQPIGPSYDDEVPGHELGPDGYKYKVPSKKFKF